MALVSAMRFQWPHCLVHLSSVSFDGGFSGSGVLVFDRQKYDVKWEHYVEDYVLSDDIEIKLEIVASK